MAQVDVSVSVAHEGSTWVGEWNVYPAYTGSDGNVAPNCYLVVSRMINGNAVPVSDLIGASRRQIMDATMLLARERAMAVRSQLFPTGDESVEQVLNVILERVRNGDWMGQTTHNQEFTTHELALLLDVTEREAGALAASLEESKKATVLPGGIIMPTNRD